MTVKARSETDSTQKALVSITLENSLRNPVKVTGYKLWSIQRMKYYSAIKRTGAQMHHG